MYAKVIKKLKIFVWKLKNPEQGKLVDNILNAKLTFLSPLKMYSLVDEIKRIESSRIEGAVIEAGCALGGSAILLSKLKSTSRPFNVYDVFDMIPPPSEEDPADVHERYKTIKEGKAEGFAGDEYYGYQKDLYSVVQKNFEQFQVDIKKENVSLIKGLLQDTMKIDGPVALAHIDVDWYDPVMTCLERITPHLVPGGVIILDDYYDWGGCKKATDEFLKGHPELQTESSSGAFKIIKA